MTTRARPRSNPLAPARGISAKIPPSPWLSARITKRQYLTEIVMTSAHKISERTPIAASGVNRPPSTDGLGDRLQGVERARPKVAIDDAERGERCRGRHSLSGAGRHGPLFSACNDRHRIPAPSATAADAGYRPIGGAQPLPDARPGSS